MPTRYMERLNLPLSPSDDSIKFTTPNGLPLAQGYNRVVLADKRRPLVEFMEKHLVFSNMVIPPSLLWRRKHPEADYVEYRSRDYCGVKVIEQRRDAGDLKAGMFYISAFDLASDKFPTLIQRLQKRRANHD